MKLLILTVIMFSLTGCISLTGLEHSVYGGLSRDYSGGETFSEFPSGHKEQGGSWSAGTKLKTIWKVQ